MNEQIEIMIAEIFRDKEETDYETISDETCLRSIMDLNGNSLNLRSTKGFDRGTLDTMNIRKECILFRYCYGDDNSDENKYNPDSDDEFWTEVDQTHE